MTEKINVRVPMMQNKGMYMAAADHELQCDILQVRWVPVLLLTLQGRGSKPSCACCCG